MLRALSAATDPTRGPRWLDSAAHALSDDLCRLRSDWKLGEIKSLEQALDWRRPKYFHQKNRRLQLKVVWFIKSRLEQGGKTTRFKADGVNVFEEAAAKFVDSDVTARAAEDWYYKSPYYKEKKSRAAPKSHESSKIRVTKRRA